MECYDSLMNGEFYIGENFCREEITGFCKVKKDISYTL